MHARRGRKMVNIISLKLIVDLCVCVFFGNANTVLFRTTWTFQTKTVVFFSIYFYFKLNLFLLCCVCVCLMSFVLCSMQTIQTTIFTEICRGCCLRGGKGWCVFYIYSVERYSSIGICGCCGCCCSCFNFICYIT